MARSKTTDRKAEYTAGQKLYVAKPLHIDPPLGAKGARRTFAIGDEFDNSLVDPRRLRQLFDGRYLDFAPPVAAEAAHGGAA